MDRDRRKILRFIGKGSVLAAFLGQIGAAGRAFFPNVLYEPPSRFKLKRPGDYPDGYTLDAAHRLFVIRQKDAFHVISAICTHLGCNVQWKDTEFDCPCHGSRFNPDGTVISGPAPRPLDWFATTVSPDGFLEVDSAQEVARDFRLLRRKRQGLNRWATSSRRSGAGFPGHGRPKAIANRRKRSSRTSGSTGSRPKSRAPAWTGTTRFWLGTASAALLLILTVTGVMLMFFYVPSTERAYGSIKDLEYAVSFGRLLRNQHRWAAEGMVAVVYIHMARVFFTGAYRGTRAINWVVGVILFLATLLLSFTGYLLPWDQLAFWAITVGTSIAKQAPVVGPTIQFILLGGHEIGQQTLLRFYVLHVFFLPVFALVLFSYHMWRVRKDGGLAAIERVRHERAMAPKATPKTKSYSLFGITPGTSVQVMSSTGLEESDQVFSSPNMSRRIALVFLIVFNITLLAALLFNAPLEGLANPSVTPNPAKAPWYFVWLQELVASTTVRMGGFTVSGALLGGILLPGFLLAVLTAMAVARSFSTSGRRAMVRTRAQAAERNLRRRDARDHPADHGRGLLARSLLADLLARPAASRDAAALLKWQKWATERIVRGEGLRLAGRDVDPVLRARRGWLLV